MIGIIWEVAPMFFVDGLVEVINTMRNRVRRMLLGAIGRWNRGQIEKAKRKSGDEI